MSVSTQWFTVDSPEAWIPHGSSLSLFNLQDYIPSDYSPNPSEEWFKLPSNSSFLDWNNFVPLPSPPSNLDPSSIWNDPVPSSVSPRTYPPAPSNTILKKQSSQPQLATVPPGSESPQLYSPRLSPSPRNFDIEVELSRQNLYKTELCRSWVESAICKYGNKCQFAHGQHELRPVIRHPKYKTEICKTFHTNGTCPYGKRCRFVHNPAELRSHMSPSDSLEALPLGGHPDNNALPEDDEELQQLQERFKLANISADPVFYPSTSKTTPVFIPGPAPDEDDDVIEHHASGSNKSGSGLPFFQRLRKQ
jgi:hypothetical protein